MLEPTNAVAAPSLAEHDFRRPAAALLMAGALFASGAAGLVNQVVWQRALRVFLGGSETICSMIVVLVFLAGLGIGSLWMSRRVARVRQPLRTFAAFEILLAGVNLGVCVLLASDLTTSVYALQRLALAVGLPLLALYTLLATLVLIVPCVLMGATMPLAAESCQRSLRLRDGRVIGWLYGLNTLGSVLGTVVASGWMIAEFGQTHSLIVAATGNAAAGVLLLALGLRRAPAAVASGAGQPSVDDSAAPESHDADQRRKWLVLAFGLGFCSLGYEMYLFRIVPLRHQPLPFTFAAVLTGFLLFWSVGSMLSARRILSLSGALRLGALTCVASVPVWVVDQHMSITNVWSLAGFVVLRFPYFVPCLLFGYLFGTVMQSARSWGRDVGRLSAWNTLGCCLGTLVMTLVGYEVPFFMMVLALALLMYAMQEYSQPAGATVRALLPAGAAVAVIAGSLVVEPSRWPLQDRLYSGRDGVIFITPKKQLVWDGLWHSHLSEDGNHIGTNNWYLGVCPVLSHGTGDVRDVCIIGVCTGITVGTLAKLDSVERIDGYDITHMLKRIYADYPDGTLNIATNPKVNLIWQDARTGLALNPKKYDLIQTQPLYLMQSGSAQLNSVEFYRLVSQRLKPGGVFCLYSNGTPEQAFVVRETAAQAFAYRETFLNGYLVICSNDPIDVSEAALAKRFQRDDPLWREIRGYAKTATAADARKLVDQPRLEQGDGMIVITDNYPIVEYPEALHQRIRAKGYTFRLPDPR